MPWHRGSGIPFGGLQDKGRKQGPSQGLLGPDTARSHEMVRPLKHGRPNSGGQVEPMNGGGTHTVGPNHGWGECTPGITGEIREVESFSYSIGYLIGVSGS